MWLSSPVEDVQPCTAVIINWLALDWSITKEWAPSQSRPSINICSVNMPLLCQNRAHTHMLCPQRKHTACSHLSWCDAGLARTRRTCARCQVQPMLPMQLTDKRCSPLVASLVVMVLEFQAARNQAHTGELVDTNRTPAHSCAA